MKDVYSDSKYFEYVHIICDEDIGGGDPGIF